MTALDSDAPAMKHRLSVYLDPGLLAQLNDLADRRGQPKSLVAAVVPATITIGVQDGDDERGRPLH